MSTKINTQTKFWQRNEALQHSICRHEKQGLLKYYRYPFVMITGFNWSEVHLFKVTSYKIHTLFDDKEPKLGKLDISM